MELTILLSKVFGVYLIVGGLAFLIRQKYFMSVMREWVEHRMLRTIVAVAEFIAGLFLIFTHNVWTSWPEGITSAVGWILALEGAFYLLVPDRMVRSIVRACNTKAWYVGGGIASIAIGLYLVNFGFNIGLF